MKLESSVKPRLMPLNLILAHDPRSSACDLLLERVARAVGGPTVLDDVGSLEAAWVALDRARRAPGGALVLACLDLAPAPRAGATVAEWARSLKLPVVAVTRGARWLPVNRAGLSLISTLSPAADQAEVDRVVQALLGADLHETFDPPPESFPGRPSWV
ncbi:MAG: hypothetical protein IPG04_20295 [Polyangiaceae bacterium]|nr:hypothetical protein [Polyangiaceae bacterium]